MNQPENLRYVTIPPELAGQRLDRALAALCPDLSRSRLKALIEGGALAGSKELEPSDAVRAGDAFTLTVPSAAPAVPRAQAIPLSILFEDEAVLVIDKPSGLVVHPAPGHADGTLVNAVLAHCGESLLGVGGERRPGIVHRLDKDTSGVMVVAKSDAALQGLATQFADHSIEREYLAFTARVPVPLQGLVDAPIGRHPNDRKRMAVTEKGRTARTHYRVEETFGQGAALVRCRLETGRTHQIRVHLSHIGHPVLGDPVYMRSTRGRRADLGESVENVRLLGRQALHAAILGFTHPISAERVRFEVEMPPDLHILHESLMAHAS
ncbi:MAG TPA: RluA family pseudouridine synthase [Alphaproteobacteria bacterium]|nr:RluA family pseudouridine synthase [Alphaproteobacteria bacterium]